MSDPQKEGNPFVLAALVALPALLALSAAAPGGGTWLWREVPWQASLVAIGMAAWGAHRRSLRAALAAILVVPLALVVYVALEGRYTCTAIARTAFSLAPWLLGLASGALIALAARGVTWRAVAQRRAAAGWLAIMGGIDLLLALANRSWLTLEGIGKPGTYRSSVDWPDTKVVALVLAGATIVFAVAWALAAWRAGTGAGTGR